MKKLLLSLVLMAFAATSMTAQTTNQNAAPVKKECCKEHKDGQQCNKPADQQCTDCKEKAAQKHECKKAEGKQCEKAAQKHECKKAEGKQCEKAAQKHECKKAEGKQCDKAAMKKDCCKDKKMEGKKCDKPADQQCPDCKAKAAAKKN